MPPAIETINQQVQNRKGGEDTINDILYTTVDRRAVTVYLSDINFQESLPERIITLEHPSWTIDIGRGSCSDDNIVPEADNAWFTSKVMSRQHATIKADPELMLLTIKDTNSMHGTFLNGDKITGQDVDLLSNDIITFGTDVIRHAESFTPLKTKVVYEWFENAQPNPTKPKDCSNTFTADYSEEDNYSDLDDEVEIIHDSIRQPSVEILDCDPALQRTSSTSTSPNKSSESGRVSSSSIPTSSPEEAVINGNSPKKTVVETTSIEPLEDEDEYNSESDDDYPGHQSENDDLSASENYEEDDDDEEPDDSEHEDSEDDEDPVTMLARGTPTRVQATLSKTNPMRQPSPSDAAMAKPPQTLPSQAQPSKAPFCPPFVGNVPYGLAPGSPPLPGFSTFGPTSQHWAWDNTMSPVYSPITNRGPFGYEIDHQGPFHGYTVNPPELPRAPLPRLEQLSNLSPLSVLSHPGGVHYPAPPLTHPEPVRPPKRKAAEISADQEANINSLSNTSYDDPSTMFGEKPETGSVHRNDAELNSSQTYIPDSPQIQTSQTVVAIESSVEESENEITPAVSDKTTSILKGVSIVVEPIEDEAQEPPRKKIKTEIPDTASGRTGSVLRTVAKYTATALAGVSVGAVGAVLGLASLPPDYFA